MKNKVFISHSSKDREYVRALIELLEGIGLSEEDIFCSSIPEYGIPLNNNIYDYLANEFQRNNLIVLYILSDHYYASAACLNEMGAAWVLKKTYSSILLPGFSYKEIEGAIDPCKIGIKLDVDQAELKYRLGELKDLLIDQLSLKLISSGKWERYRDKYINEVQSLKK